MNLFCETCRRFVLFAGNSCSDPIHLFQRHNWYIERQPRGSQINPCETLNEVRMLFLLDIFSVMIQNNHIDPKPYMGKYFVKSDNGGIIYNAHLDSLHLEIWRAS